MHNYTSCEINKILFQKYTFIFLGQISLKNSKMGEASKQTESCLAAGGSCKSLCGNSESNAALAHCSDNSYKCCVPKCLTSLECRRSEGICVLKGQCQTKTLEHIPCTSEGCECCNTN